MKNLPNWIYPLIALLFLIFTNCENGVTTTSNFKKESITKKEFPFTKEELIDHAKSMDSNDNEFKGVLIDDAIHSLLSKSEINDLMFFRFKRRSAVTEEFKRTEAIYNLRKELYKTKDTEVYNEIMLEIDSIMKENVASSYKENVIKPDK